MNVVDEDDGVQRCLRSWMEGLTLVKDGLASSGGVVMRRLPYSSIAVVTGLVATGAAYAAFLAM